MSRSLYQCFHSKVKGKGIYCGKGHDLKVGILRLARGEPLEYAICQSCPDYEEMGPPLTEWDRGWIKLSLGELIRLKGLKRK